MFQKIFFITIQYPNYIGLTIYMAYALFKSLPKRLQCMDFSKKKEGVSAESYAFHASVRQLLKIGLSILPFAVLSTTACLLDTLHKESYMWLIFVFPFVLGFLLAVAIDKEFGRLQKKCGLRLPAKDRIGDFTFYIASAIGFIYSLVLGQLIYTTALLFV